MKTFQQMTPAERGAFLAETQAAYERSLPRFVPADQAACHGITARISHAFELNKGTISLAPRGYIHKWGQGVIVGTRVQVYQSNGFVLMFDSLKHALTFCRSKQIPAWVNFGGARQKKRRLC